MEKSNRVIGLAVLALAAVLSTYIAASTWQRVKTWRANTIDVTGSAKRRIQSDLIVWEASIATRAPDRQSAYRELRTGVEKTLAYLDEHGIQSTEISVAAVETKALVDKEVSGTGEERVEKTIDRGFQTRQVIRVSSSRVTEVERVSREVTELIDADVPVVSEPPRYFYTKLGDLKIEMLAEASKDARTRAERILASAGNAGVGKLRKADMGVINVNPANSTGTSWDGNNDTSSFDKDIVTIVHCTFDME
jgi:hypothetical protein